MNKNHVRFWKMGSPPLTTTTTTVKPCSHSGAVINFYCQHHNQELGGGGNTPALIMSSATGAHINTQHRNTTTNLSHTQHTPGEWMLLLISGLMCETSHKYRSPAYKRCFVFFRISRAVIVLQHPGKWLALYLDKQVNAAMKQTDAPNHTNLQLHLRRSRLLDFL